MKNYLLKYRNARKRWIRAINRYFQETGKKICKETYLDIMYVPDPDVKHGLIYNPELPKYVTSANDHFEDVENDLICWQQHHRNRKQRKDDYIKRIRMIKDQHLSREDFEKEKREIWFTWMKR